MQGSQVIELSYEQVQDLLRRVDEEGLEKQDYRLIRALLENWLFLYRAIQQKNASIQRLRRLLFGPRTERSKDLFAPKAQPPEGLTDACPDAQTQGGGQPQGERKKPKGHGRNGAEAFPEARRVAVPHADLKGGDPCPQCPKGKVYPFDQPQVLIRFQARPPIEVTLYELEQLRCNACLAVFPAQPPEEAGQNKYDETVGSMLAVLRYGNGLPLHRIAGLQKSMNRPLACSTQWEILEGKANRVYPAFEEIIRQGAQGELFHNDDTLMRILALMRKAQEQGDGKTRKGTFTTGIVSVTGGRRIALFFTGRRHAGENLEAVLERRQSGRGPPLQMCDALSRNHPQRAKTIAGYCMTHGRRNFVDVSPSFPEPCRYVIETLGEVYKNEETTKKQKMSPWERLAFHQSRSAPWMAELREWMQDEIAEKRVEPNSGLGQAIRYMLTHWRRLTLFLWLPGAPLDNSAAEQMLKRAIQHRKNSLFYKTEHGAYIGDMYMSLIHTCYLNGKNPFHYLTELHRHSSDVFKNPPLWMPWNYQERLASLQAAAA